MYLSGEMPRWYYQAVLQQYIITRDHFNQRVNHTDLVFRDHEIIDAFHRSQHSWESHRPLALFLWARLLAEAHAL